MSSLSSAPLQPPTIVDVLENALGQLSQQRVRSLSKADIADLEQVVNAFYDAWDVPALPADDLRMYLGGWVAENPENPESKQHLYTSLLYSPSAILHDPVAEWFDPGREQLRSPPEIWAASRAMAVQGAETQLLRGDGYFAFRDEPERTRDQLARAIPVLVELAPLIRSGLVIPIPQWRVVRKHQDAILTAVRHDAQDADLAALIEQAADQPPPRTDHIRGADVTPPGGVAPADHLRAVSQNPAYFLNKTAFIASATGSRYVPPAATDAALWNYRVSKLATELKRKDIDLQVVSALSSTELPFLGSLDAKTILDVHRDEQAFSDWRAELRAVARTIEAAPSAGQAFVDEASEVIADVLVPRAREIERAISRSAILKAAVQDQAVTLGVGTASISGAAAIVGAPLAPAALVGLGMTAVGRAVYASVFSPAPQGSHAVLASLIKRE